MSARRHSSGGEVAGLAAQRLAHWRGGRSAAAQLPGTAHGKASAAVALVRAARAGARRRAWSEGRNAAHAGAWRGRLQREGVQRFGCLLLPLRRREAVELLIGIPAPQTGTQLSQLSQCGCAVGGCSDGDGGSSVSHAVEIVECAACLGTLADDRTDRSRAGRRRPQRHGRAADPQLRLQRLPRLGSRRCYSLGDILNRVRRKRSQRPRAPRLTGAPLRRRLASRSGRVLRDGPRHVQ
eukprot:357949-Chlamydomonas_euryale.AAC.4